jgi:hypothetical protein
VPGLNGTPAIGPRARYVRETSPEDVEERERGIRLIRAARTTSTPPPDNGMLIAFAAGILAVLVTLLVVSLAIGGFG